MNLENIVLPHERKQVFEVKYGDLDTFLSGLYAITFEVIEEEGLDNGKKVSFNVESEPLSEYWRGHLKNNNYSTRALLNDACARGYIAPGEYLISASW